MIRDHLLQRWHKRLDMPRHPAEWYEVKLVEEIEEERVAATFLAKISESADVIYLITRSKYDGVPVDMELPAFKVRHLLVYPYMVSKYTSRYAFYRAAAKRANCPDVASVREVINPKKASKLHDLACRHGMDPATFSRVCRKLRRFWPLLP